MAKALVAPSDSTTVPSTKFWSRWRRILIILFIISLILVTITVAIVSIHFVAAQRADSQQTTNIREITTGTSPTVTSTDSSTLSVSTDTTTSSDEYHIVYGSATTDLIEQGVSITSTIMYNPAATTFKAGYVTNITVNFLQSFDPDATADGFLWFFIISHFMEIKSSYNVKPISGVNAPLLQSFTVPQRILTLYNGWQLAVGTFAKDKNGKINQLQTVAGGIFGYAPLTNEAIISTPIALNNEKGIALSFIVTHNLETSALNTDVDGPDVDVG